MWCKLFWVQNWKNNGYHNTIKYYTLKIEIAYKDINGQGYQIVNKQRSPFMIIRIHIKTNTP